MPPSFNPAYPVLAGTGRIIASYLKRHPLSESESQALAAHVEAMLAALSRPAAAPVQTRVADRTRVKRSYRRKPIVEMPVDEIEMMAESPALAEPEPVGEPAPADLFVEDQQDAEPESPELQSAPLAESPSVTDEPTMTKRKRPSRPRSKRKAGQVATEE